LPAFQIDNLVTRFDRSSEFPAPWMVVRLRRPIRGLFANDRVSWDFTDWIVHEIRDGGAELVLRPT